MFRRTLTRKPFIVVLLVLQLIPLVIFPLSTFSLTTQDWWLPVILAILVVIADVEILFQKRDVMWPWYLIAFSQGFNVISRLMMVFPHAMMNVNGTQVANVSYLVISLISLLFSVFAIWFFELPEVRMQMLRE